MAFRPTEMGTLCQVNPKRAKTVLLSAFKKHKGNTTRVSEHFAVNVATVKRWIKRLEVREEIETLRAAA